MRNGERVAKGDVTFAGTYDPAKLGSDRKFTFVDKRKGKFYEIKFIDGEIYLIEL